MEKQPNADAIKTSESEFADLIKKTTSEFEKIQSHIPPETTKDIREIYDVIAGAAFKGKNSVFMNFPVSLEVAGEQGEDETTLAGDITVKTEDGKTYLLRDSNNKNFFGAVEQLRDRGNFGVKFISKVQKMHPISRGSMVEKEHSFLVAEFTW